GAGEVGAALHVLLADEVDVAGAPGDVGDARLAAAVDDAGEVGRREVVGVGRRPAGQAVRSAVNLVLIGAGAAGGVVAAGAVRRHGRVALVVTDAVGVVVRGAPRRAVHELDRNAGALGVGLLAGHAAAAAEVGDVVLLD